jgi:hypothetical protein
MTLAKKDATAEPVRCSNMRDSDPPSKKVYQKPRVRQVGKLDQAILSPTAGTFESGLGAGFRG